MNQKTKTLAESVDLSYKLKCNNEKSFRTK